MVFTQLGRRMILPAALAAAIGMGFVAGRFSNRSGTATPTENAVYAEEATTIVPPKPRNRAVVPGVGEFESDGPIVIDSTEAGDGATFASSGEARSPGISTNAGEQALKLALESGVPVIVRPDGTFTTAAIGGGGSFDIELSGNTGWMLIALGAIVFLCGPGGFIFGRKIGVGLSLTEAGMISGAGLVLVAMGLYPALASTLILIAAGLAAAYGVFYVIKSRKVGKVSARALAAARMVKAIDEADTGDGSAGDTIKKAVSANVGKGTDLERVIDEIIAEAGA